MIWIFTPCESIAIFTFFKKRLGEVKLFSKTYPIIMGNLISFLIFTFTGSLVVYLTLATDFSMADMATGFSKEISKVTLWLNALPGANIIFLVVIGLFLIALIKYAVFRKNEDE